MQGGLALGGLDVGVQGHPALGEEERQYFGGFGGEVEHGEAHDAEIGVDELGDASFGNQGDVAFRNGLE